MDFEVKKLTRSGYEEFLGVLNTAFETGASDWFQRNIDNCVPFGHIASDAEIGRHFVAEAGGRIIGAVGAYPLDWEVSGEKGKAVIPAYGIGQVSCLKEYRGVGVMTALLNRAAGEMRGQGRALGFLGGDRFRYCHFGYDFGGQNLGLQFDRGRMEKRVSDEGLSVRRAGQNDWQGLDAMYSALPSRILRGERSWELQFLREKFAFEIGEAGGRKAYICYHSEAGARGDILEICGDPAAAAALLLRHMKANGLNGARLLAPMDTESALSRELLSHASGMSAWPINLVAVTDAEKLAERLAPAIGDVEAKNVRELVGFYPKLLTMWHSELDDI